MGVFTAARDVWHQTSHAEARSAILHYVSKFQRSEWDNEFVTGKTNITKTF